MVGITGTVLSPVRERRVNGSRRLRAARERFAMSVIELRPLHVRERFVHAVRKWFVTFANGGVRETCLGHPSTNTNRRQSQRQ